MANKLAPMFRPWRSGAFRVQGLALLLAAFALTALTALRMTVEYRFEENAAQAVGGDVVLDGTSQPSAEQRQYFSSHRHSERLTFSSVLINNDVFLLSSITAVDQHYPLYGQVTVSRSGFDQHEAVTHGPAAGEIWLAGNAMQQLSVSIGDNVTLGQTSLQLTRKLVQEPDQQTSFYSMQPRGLIHIDDLAGSGVMGPGSRFEHQLLAAVDGNEQQPLVDSVQSTLRPDQSVQRAADSTLVQQGPIQQLFLWSQLAVMLVVMLCAASIYLTAGLRARQQRTMIGVMKTLGASRSAIVRRTLARDMAHLLLPSVMGVALGAVLALFIQQLLGGSQPMALLALIGGVVAPLLLWLGFALPTLWQQFLETPLSLLRSGLHHQRTSWPVIVIAVLTPVPLAWMLAGSLTAMLPLLLLMAIVAIALPLVLWPIMMGLDRSALAMPFTLRLALRRLSRRKVISLPLLSALILAMAVISLSVQAGRELLSDWRATLPDDAPNYFVLNLFDQDLDVLDQWLGDMGVSQTRPPYPVTRGRLVEINDLPVQQAVTKEDDQAERALNRDLSLTETEQLSSSNVISAGRWVSAVGEVSVEQELAEGLGLAIGDRLTFTLPDGSVSAEVVGFREVDWESFAPNFYFMFGLGTLAEHDRTWLTSFLIDDAQQAELRRLVQLLPHISVLDVNGILDTLEGIIQQASQAALLVGILLLLAAVLVMAAALLADAPQQRQDNRLIQVLGGRISQVRRISVWRALLLVGGAAVLANVLHLLALWPLGQRIFDGQMPLSGWILLPWAVVILVTLLAAWRPGIAASTAEGSP